MKTFNCHEKELKNLKHASIQANGAGIQILAELIQKMQWVTMAPENLRKQCNQMLKFN